MTRGQMLKPLDPSLQGQAKSAQQEMFQKLLNGGMRLRETHTTCFRSCASDWLCGDTHDHNRMSTSMTQVGWDGEHGLIDSWSLDGHRGSHPLSVLLSFNSPVFVVNVTLA